jgi:hypothetical protein
MLFNEGILSYTLTNFNNRTIFLGNILNISSNIHKYSLRLLGQLVVV